VVLAETENARYVAVDGQGWLDFAGVARPTIYALAEEMQFAEKLHAYTYPWETTENTRAKDLLDMLMLSRRLSPTELTTPIREIFAARGRQPPPDRLMTPPPSWQATYQQHAKEYGYEGNMDECFQEISAFYSAVVKAGVSGGISAGDSLTKEKEKMTTKTSNQFDVQSMIDDLVKTNAYPQLKDKSLTECIALAIKGSQTANTAQANQWHALLQALLTGAIVDKLDQFASK